MTAGAQTVAGAKSFSDDLSVAATKKLFLDGGGDSYLIESAANTVDIFVGGASRISSTTGAVTFTIPIYLPDAAHNGVSIAFASDTNTGISNGGAADNIEFATGGTWRLSIGTTTAYMNVDFLAAGAASMNIGNAASYINDVSYKTLTDRGCLPWCDDGVELSDGKIVSDLKALCSIKKHETEKTIHGLPKLDYRTFPKKSYRPAAIDGKLLPRDKDDFPVGGADGIEMTMMFGVFIGAFKEVNTELDDLKAKVTDLNQRIATLEKAA